MKSIRALLTVLLLTGILGLSTGPVRANEGFIDEEIIVTDVDPSDDVHGGQIVLRELEIVTGVRLTNLTRG